MHTQQLLLKLRIQWFKLNTKEFIQRHQNGLIMLIFLLPGVAVGDNLYLLFKGLTFPFLQITQLQTPFLNKLLCLILLQSIFITFCCAQKKAITGGGFRLYIRSLPVSPLNTNKLDFWLMLLGNNFLWVIIVGSFYFQLQIIDANKYISIFNNLLLIFFLFTAQYVALFKLCKRNVAVLVVLNLLFILNVSVNYGFALNLVILIIWFVFLVHLSKPSQFVYKTSNKKRNLIFGINNSIYYQILFRATATSTLFRLLFIFLLMIGFVLFSGHLEKNSFDYLFPYSMAFEALLAYYLSGFYVCFNDQRQSMKSVLMTLPISKTFWFYRDFLTVIIITLIAHILLFVLLMGFYNMNEMFNLLRYHVVLLLVCYPIRLLVKSHQTILTFVALIIITAITLFNIS